MKKISGIINLQKIRNSKNLTKSYTNEQEILRKKRTEAAFLKLWALLQTHFQQQNFSEKMGAPDGSIAKLWRYEFEKNGIGFIEIVLIGNNLAELDNPGFIPNAFQLIGIVKRVYENEEVKIAHERRSRQTLSYPSKAEVSKKREETKVARNHGFCLIRDILS